MPHLTFVPRRLHVINPKVEPLRDERQTKTDSQQTESGLTFQSISKLSHINIPLHSSTQTSACLSRSELIDSAVTKKSSDKKKHPSLTKSKKIAVVVAITAIVFLCVTAAILTPVLMLELRSSSSSSFANISVSTCAAQTCIGSETPFRTSMITVMYPFTGNTLDVSGSLSGTALGLTLPVYTSSWTNTDSINFVSTSLQYVSIPYVSLAKQSFTLEVWLFPTTVTGQVDYGVFGQCGSDLICLSISLRNNRVTVSFDSLNNSSKRLTGTSVLTYSNWIHVAVVYDAVMLQQTIYVNGRIDVVSTGTVYAYQGSSTGATTTIAMTSSLGYQPSYFNGNIDLFTISAGIVRSVCQIYNDATLMAYYPLDTSFTLADHGVNLYNGYSSGVTMLSSGRINQAILLSQATSCFQAQCFMTTRTSNSPFTASIWVNPTTVSGGTIVHLSSYQLGNGSICFDLLGLTSAGVVTAQLYQGTTGTVGIDGPILSMNTWTHLAVIYSSANGLRLFVNGQVYLSSTSATVLWPFNSVNRLYVTLGNNSPVGPSAGLSCPSNSSLVVSGAYNGAIDEFRLYSRELSLSEICVLANP